MRDSIKIVLAFSLLSKTLMAQQTNNTTYCNPVNISYRFCLDQPSRREAADPSVILFKGTYFLFASKSGGYWYSDDLLNWNFVTSAQLPLENYAPTAMVLNDSVYFFTSGSNTIFRTNDPKTGNWEIYNKSFPISDTDPALFADTDGKVYLYYGCSNTDSIHAVELNVHNKLNPKGKPINCFGGKLVEHGWEKPGDYNEKSGNPWIEGSFMTKYNGKYYLQYAGPGTEFKSYSDGVYVSDNPLGPFTYAENNPFSSKPGGFACGAGHGSTFADKYGNYWHIATVTISVKHMFERRLCLYPAGFDAQGNLFTSASFGDYPIKMPNRKYKNVNELSSGWMLLSFNKTAEASSTIDSYPISYALDEDIRTYWSAATGDKNEWLSVDLDSVCSIKAVQVNFAENNTQLFGRENILSHQYLIEYSLDKQKWTTLIDETNNTQDLTHSYFEIKKPVKARFLKITNYRVPGGTFAISGFRVFGTKSDLKPSKVTGFNPLRDKNDPRTIKLLWKKQANAIGYEIKFGSEKDKMYHSYLVYRDTSVTIRSLDAKKGYWFRIDAFNENGVTSGKPSETSFIK